MTGKPVRKDAAATEQAVQDVLWLCQHGAWRGVAAVLAERRRQIDLGHTTESDRGDLKPGWLSRQSSVQAAVGAFMAEEDPDPDSAAGLVAEAGALAMAEIDRLPFLAAIGKAG
jgi:hypothetical protein